jgi:hypothetical protein
MRNAGYGGLFGYQQRGREFLNQHGPESTDPKGAGTMWDTTDTANPAYGHLSHDMQCQRCGHAVHTYLACSDRCACVPLLLPGVPEPRRAA